MDNVDVARVLDEVADLLEILGQNAFRVRAYRTAARTVEAHGEPVTAIVRRDPSELAELPGIGKDLGGKIAEIATTGDLALRRELCEKVPATLAAMMRVDGVGPKRAKLFYDELQLRTVDELEAAARRGALHEVRGIGEILEKRILAGCEQQRVRSTRIRLSEADAHAQPLVEYLRASRAAIAVDVCGSLRRRRETIGDIDILVAADRPAVLASHLLAYPDIDKVLAHGATKCSFVLRSGMQVDVRIVEPACYGAALHYFTGSKSHNIAIRKLGLKRHLKISEYGVFRGERRVSGRTEDEVFRAVGLPWIPPELREDRGEVQAAREGRLPKLVVVSRIRGDLHMHTTATDGKNSLEEMVAACAARGYEYMAITDHTKAVRVAGGMGAAEFRKQRREIDALRRKVHGITILHGAEVDILEDGRLDLDDAALDELDIVVAAVHSKLEMPVDEMTERVLRALTSGRVHVLAHPTGRLLGARAREPSAIDIDRIARAAHEHGVLLEINAQPDRLDLSDVLIQAARVAGARFVIDTDAHRISELDFMRHGVDQARRGWCTPDEIANTLPRSDLMALLRRPGERAPEAQERRRAVFFGAPFA